MIARFFLFFLVCSFGAWANEPIDHVVIQGNQRIETSAIENVLSSKAGYMVSQNLVTRDIRSLYATGYFEQVIVLYDDETSTLIVEVQEKPTIIKVMVEGNDKEKTKDIEKQIEVKAYTFLNQKKVKEDLERIKQYYDSKGFYLAFVNYRLVEKKNQEVELIYTIEEHQKVFIQRIHFVGNEKFSNKDLKGAIRTKEKGFLAFINRSGNYYKELLEFDRQMLSEFYGSRGFIAAKIQPPKVEILKDKQTLIVTFYVEEGVPYTLSGYDIGGELIYDKDFLLDKIKMKKGDLASIDKIREDLRNVSAEYMDQGYAYANVVPNFQFADDKKEVFIDYQVSPGEKIYIRNIRIEGNDANRDKIFLREMDIQEGELYSAKHIRQSKQKIERLALFETVDVTTPKTDNPQAVDILITVKERQTGSFNIGAGFNTLESFQIIGSLEKRSLFGYGVDINLRAQIGKITQIFDLTYIDPYFLDTQWAFTVNAFNIGRRFTNFSLVSTGAGIGFDYPLYMEGLKRIRAGANYRIVKQDLDNLRPTVEALFADGVTSSTTVYILRDSRNRVMFASDGSYYKLSQEFAGSIFGGDNSFTKTEFDARLFLPVAERSTIPLINKSFVAFRFNTGYVAPLESGTRVPLFERYFPGGVFSIRGFRLRSLGPKISVASSNDLGNLATTDFIIGGNKQVVFNAEYVVPFIDSAQIFGVLFFDMGNAFDNGESMLTFTGQRMSTGFELRWFSPLAPLRFAWGFPLDRQQDEKVVQFDFTFGSLF